MEKEEEESEEDMCGEKVVKKDQENRKPKKNQKNWKKLLCLSLVLSALMLPIFYARGK